MSTPKDEQIAIRALLDQMYAAWAAGDAQALWLTAKAARVRLDTAERPLAR